MFEKIKSLLFSNRSTKQTVAKNTFWLFISNVFSRFIRAALVIYAARLLTPREWGAFNYAMSLVAFFTIFADFGVNAVMTRESAKDITQQEKYFSTAFFIKVVAGAAIIVFLLLFYPVLLPYLTSSAGDYSLVSVLIPIVAFVVIFDSLRDFGAALSRAWEKMEIESIIQVITNVIIVGAGLLALYYVKSAHSLAIGYTVGTATGMVISFVPFRRYFKTIFSNFSWKSVKSVLASSWPFGLMGVMGSIMLNTDSIMIGWLRSIEAVGYYSAGQRIVSIIYTMPALIAAAFFPTLVKATEDKERFRRLLEKAVVVLSLLALPLSVGGAILSKQMIQFLYGVNYLPGTTALVIMTLTLPTSFVAAVYGNALFALKKEMKLFGYVALALFGNTLFDFLFIPIWGIAGAALSTLINQIISVGYLMWLLKKETPYNYFSGLGKPLLASLIMGFFVYALYVLGISLIPNIIIGGIIYFGALLLFREENILDVIHSGTRAILGDQ